jgi:hypothetical protein
MNEAAGKPIDSLLRIAANLTASAMRVLASSLIGFLCPVGSLNAIVCIVFGLECKSKETF